MEKLLKLLNEYEEEGIIFDEVDDEECFVDVHPCTLWTEYNGHLWFNNANKVQFDKWMFDKVAISKDYGFIKWLVDNDKIDRNKIYWLDIGYKIDEIGIGERKNTVDIDLSNKLLMLLAISDNPIDFLIEILK